VVPNVETVKAWASSNNIPGTLTVLCNNAEIKNLILSDMTTLGKDAGLKSFEQVGLGLKFTIFEPFEVKS
jgi:long-chain acyl-CoA synthetase